MKALVTGASSGMGRDMARYLSKLGYDLIVVARRKNRLEELKNECKTNVRVIPMDLSIEENLYKLFEMTKDENIDVLVNDAGFGIFGQFKDTDVKREMEMIDVNVRAMHVLTKLYLQQMVERDSGYILNVASLAGYLPCGPLLSTYYATKAYILSLTRAIATELRKTKSKVNISALCPGPVDTEFNAVAGVEFTVKALDSGKVAKYAIDKMLKRKLNIVPGIIAKTTAFLTRILSVKALSNMAYNIQHAKMKK